MGYRSSICIAIHKSIVVQDLIAPIIPDCLKDEPWHDINNARYWKLDDWKWYDNYPDVQAIGAFFEALDEIEEIKSNYDTELNPELATITMSVYGALRIGEEDGDNQEWGTPYDYDIYINRSIDSPVNQ